MLTWQQELTQVLDEVGHAGAERLIRAIDEGRMDPSAWMDSYVYGCGTVACIYGHCYASVPDAEKAAKRIGRSAANVGIPSGWDNPISPLETELVNHPLGDTIRPEVVRWLAEHGSTVERSIEKEMAKR